MSPLLTPCSRAAVSQARVRPSSTVPIGTPRSVWVCGSKNSSACSDVVDAGPLEVGHRHVEEVLSFSSTEAPA